MSLSEAKTVVLKPAGGTVTLNRFSLEIIAEKSVGLTEGKASRLWPCLFGTSALKKTHWKGGLYLYNVWIAFAFTLMWALNTIPPKQSGDLQNAFGENRALYMDFFLSARTTLKVQPLVKSMQRWQTDPGGLLSKQCLAHSPWRERDANKTPSGYFYNTRRLCSWSTSYAIGMTLFPCLALTVS